MKGVLIFLIGLLVSADSFADERLFNRLQKRFDKDSAKAISYTKKMKKKHSREPDTYYYLAQISFQKFNLAPNLIRKYSSLNSAASNSYKVKKYGRNSPYLSPYFDSLTRKLSTALVAYRDTFLNHEDLDKSERMAYQYHRLTGNYLPTLEEIEEKKEAELKLKKLALQVPRVIDGKYYGLPSGKEDLRSIDPNAEREVVKILNAARIAKGLKPLTWDYSLAKSARYHANDMASQNYFSHSTKDSINGELIEIAGAFKRIRKFYTCCGFANGENIAAGSGDPKDTYSQWFTSQGHHDIMFKANTTRVAVGVAYNPHSAYQYYWVMCTARN